MALGCGIVGLPNVGKTTVFKALTSSKIETSNYPFSTVSPNVGIVAIPDSRLDQIATLFKPKSLIPTVMEFVDIVGLVKGASQGGGRGNQFLSHIREVSAIAHVVRCFEDSNVVHVDGSISPIRDIETIEAELCLADLDTLAKGLDKAAKNAKSGNKEWSHKKTLFELLVAHVEELQPVRTFQLTLEDQAILRDLHLLTCKPVLYVCNVSEQDIKQENKNVAAVRNYAESQGAKCVVISAKVEAELGELPESERQAFLNDLGLSEPGLNRMIHNAYDLLQLITFFTAGEKECRAWTIRKGYKAPQAAGTIHTDFERGFIRAEIYGCEDLFKHRSEAELRAKGLIRLEGKDYIMKDGDVAHFRFNV